MAPEKVKWMASSKSGLTFSWMFTNYDNSKLLLKEHYFLFLIFKKNILQVVGEIICLTLKIWI